jgi:Ca2+-binding EF-hand superfamily protein
MAPHCTVPYGSSLRHRFEAHFARIDANKDGYLDWPELYWYLHAGELERQQVLFANEDLNGDGKLSLSECVQRSINTIEPGSSTIEPGSSNRSRGSSSSANSSTTASGRESDTDSASPSSEQPRDSSGSRHSLDYALLATKQERFKAMRFEFCDEDHDGHLDIQEFVAYQAPQSSRRKLQYFLAEAAFDIASSDADNSGSLSYSEMNAEMRSFGADYPLEVFERADLNTDGDLDQEELARLHYPAEFDGLCEAGCNSDFAECVGRHSQDAAWEGVDKRRVVSDAEKELAQLVLNLVGKAAEDCEKKEGKDGGDTSQGKALGTAGQSSDHTARRSQKASVAGAAAGPVSDSTEGTIRGPVGGSVVLHLLHYNGEQDIDPVDHLGSLKLVKLSKQDCMADIEYFIEEIEENSGDEL